MRASLLSLSALLACGLAFSSCKKDKDDPTPAKSKTEILTQSGRKWKITGDMTEIKVGTSATTTVDNFATSYDACDKDDFTIFRADKTLTTDPGTLKCAPSDAVETSTWDFNSDQTVLQLPIPGFGGLIAPLTIVQLDDNTLKVKYVDNSTPGTVETTTYTFTSF